MSNILDLYGKLYNDPAKYMEAVSHFGAGTIEQIPAESLSDWASEQPDLSGDYGTGTDNSYSFNSYEGDE